MCVSVYRAFGTNRNHVDLYWKCSAGRQGRTEDGKEGGHDSCPVDNTPPLENSTDFGHFKNASRGITRKKEQIFILHFVG